MRQSAYIFAIVLAITLGTSGPALSQSIVVPSAPLNPRSTSECTALSREYSEVLWTLRQRYHRLYSQQPWTEQLRAQIAQNLDQSRQVASQRDREQRTCLNTVAANERANSRERQANYQDLARKEIARSAIEQTRGLVADSLISYLSEKSPAFAAVHKTFTTLEKIQARIDRIVKPRGSVLDQYQRVSERLQVRSRLNPVAALNLNLARSLTRTVQEAALTDVLAGLDQMRAGQNARAAQRAQIMRDQYARSQAQREAVRKNAKRLIKMRSNPEVGSDGGEANAELVVNSAYRQFQARRTAVIDQSKELFAARGTDSQSAMAAAAEARRAAEARQAAVARSRSGGARPEHRRTQSERRTTDKKAASDNQCRQLAARLCQMQRVLRSMDPSAWSSHPYSRESAAVQNRLNNTGVCKGSWTTYYRQAGCR